MPKRILILGGTEDARHLASLLVEKGHDATTSLAGRTSSPLMPKGKTRSGGFGGTSGMSKFIRTEGIEIIADASHPFAAQISRNGFEAAMECSIDYVRLERPQWKPGSGDRWTSVSSLDEAAAAVPENARVLLTVGRKDILKFVQRTDLSGVVRMIEPPDVALPANWTLVLARPPFSLLDEQALMRDHGINVLVTKNSGGEQTAAKLEAARNLGLAVIMVERPAKPQARTAQSVEDLAKLITEK